MVENHKGKTIGKTIEKCLLDWGIDKVFTITMDNASSSVSALSYLKKPLRNWKGLVCGGGYLHIRCCAHILRLIVHEGLKDLKENFESIRSAVRYMRSSPAHFAKFKSFAKAEKINTKSLVCLDVSTKWNSTFLMLEAAWKLQKMFERMNDEDDDYCAHFRPSNPPPRHESKAHDFNLVDSHEVSSNRLESHDFLKRACDARREDKEKKRDDPPIVEDWNRARMLERNIMNLDSLLSDMSFNMNMKYEKYSSKAEIMNPLLIVAVILDPCYKLAYVNHIFENLFHDNEVCLAMKDRVKDCLCRVFEEYFAFVGISSESNTASSPAMPLSSISAVANVDDHDPGL
ncbi:zinc finger BED domain-containing protein RICESLEEPER 2-like [Neltuma alba]|uniref:zinc finger BED domain-containing protein RICESLEEPER 2-like n=1 Tax=Neltuma alba TaxID=207710 RepID=UPI0010A40B8B|nr:zinc finger BED domain-containing protein RICESLEEPER 2-like [Prosopis alba]